MSRDDGLEIDVSEFEDWKYSKVPEDLSFDPDVKLQSKAVFPALQRYGASSGDRRVSYQTVGARMGVSRDTIKRAVHDLVRHGWATVEERPGLPNRIKLHRTKRMPVDNQAGTGRGTDAPTGRGKPAPGTQGTDAPRPRAITESSNRTAENRQSSSARVPDPVDDDGTNPQPPEPTEHPERHPERLRARLRAVLDEAGLHDEPIPPQLVAALQVALRGNPAADDYQFHQLARCATHLSVARHPLNYLARVVQDLVNYDPSDF